MASSRPLADTPYRSYAGKLERFARFIAPELRSVFAGLGLPPRARVLDVGCGVGIATRMVANLLGGEAQVVGVDLSLPHLHAAGSGGAVDFVQADAASLCFKDATFDLVWSCNTINHLAEPVSALRAMRESEVACRTSGVDVVRIKVALLLISSAIAGAAAG